MTGPGELPGTPDERSDSIVAHVDMDCFYAACERLREPVLRGEPVVVGMGYDPGETTGAVATASYEARTYGVESAESIEQALDKLPRKIDAAKADDLSVDTAGFYRPVDLDYYESVAADIREILHDSADVVREVSIDEAYLDLTDRCRWGDTVESTARQLKGRIDSTVGVTASIGIAPTMSAAKVASDHDKPDGLVVVEPGSVRSFLAPLPVEDVHGVGPVTARELAEMDITTAGDLAEADPTVLDQRFGERGRRIYRFARGDDEREVEPRGQPKSFSRESAFTESTRDWDRKAERLRGLATAVAERAEREDVLYRTIGIKVVEPPFDVRTRARSLSGPVADQDLVEEVALSLLEEFDDVAVRKLGVRLSNLSFGSDTQPALDAFADEAAGGDTAEATRDDSRSETADSGTGNREGQRSLSEYE